MYGGSSVPGLRSAEAPFTWSLSWSYLVLILVLVPLGPDRVKGHGTVNDGVTP